MKKKIYIALIAVLWGFTSCEPYFSGMDIKNDHSPDIEAVLSDINQYPSLIGGAYKKWWTNMLEAADGDTWILATNSDSYTAGAGNWNLQVYLYSTNREKPMINNTDPTAGFPKTLWYNHYGRINTVRNMLSTIKDRNFVFEENKTDKTYKILANCYFLMGANYTELSLLFDKAFIITEDTDLEAITGDNIRPASEVRDVALDYLNKCIELCDAHDFDNFVGLLPSDAVKDNKKLKRLASFMAARALAYHPRNKSEYSSVDWNRVKGYASAGLDQDIMATLPPSDWQVWSFAAASYPDGNQWGRVNLRVINMMAHPGDPGAVWPLPTTFGEGATLPEANSDDYRLGTDFVYYPATTTPTGGLSYDGYQKYSSYVLNRFSKTGQQSGAGELYLLMKAESDLLYAEASLRTGDKVKAAELVNITRFGRGTLTDISSTSSEASVEEAIYYERFVECGYAYTATPFYDRRRTPIDKFQLSTHSFRQLPIPILELEFWGIATYTFGGELDINGDYKF